LSKHKCICDGDHHYYQTTIAILFLILILIIIFPFSKDTKPQELLGLGFANQTCIDKHMLLDNVILENDMPKIICKNNIELKKIDGVYYQIEDKVIR
jgi:hypothetical protein